MKSSQEVIERYDHHGKSVAVRTELKGKHREHCLCFVCNKFNIEDREKNCPIANALYRLCALTDIATPVWECRNFGYHNQPL